MVSSCNDGDGVIQLVATLRNVAGNYGQDGSGVVTFDREDLTPKFSGNFLIMEKVLGGGDCTRTSVDGVEVCTQVAETVTLQCKYSLEDVTVADDSFDVTGQDTAATAENTGTLGYSLVVEDNKAIGDKVTFTITPINSGLVYATIKSCDVTRGDDELTIIGHGAEHCTNDIVGAEAVTTKFTSDGPIQGRWTAFKWSTATTNDDAESQGLSCTIGLSEIASTDDVIPCTESNEPVSDEEAADEEAADAECTDNDSTMMYLLDKSCADSAASVTGFCDNSDYANVCQCTCAEPAESNEPASDEAAANAECTDNDAIMIGYFGYSCAVNAASLPGFCDTAAWASQCTCTCA